MACCQTNELRFFQCPTNKRHAFVFGGKNPPCLGYVNKATHLSLKPELRSFLGWGAWAPPSFLPFPLPSPRRAAGTVHVFLGGAWVRAATRKSRNRKPGSFGMRCIYPAFISGLNLGFRYQEGGSLRRLPFSMRSLVSGDFWGLPPNNQPFCGCRIPARTLAAAASLFLSLTAKDTGSQCFCSSFSSVLLSFPYCFFRE